MSTNQWEYDELHAQVVQGIVAIASHVNATDGPFIVRACNSHEALVRALSRLVDVQHPAYTETEKNIAEMEARAALNLAKEPA